MLILFGLLDLFDFCSLRGMRGPFPTKTMTGSCLCGGRYCTGVCLILIQRTFLRLLQHVKPSKLGFFPSPLVRPIQAASLMQIIGRGGV
jgi:hypothetical protein